VVRTFLENGIDPRDSPDEDGVGAIHLAVAADSIPLVQLLLERGVPVDEETVFGSSPLHLARSGRMARFLIELVQIQTQLGTEAWNVEGLTPLHVAAANGRAAVVRALLQAGADMGGDNAEAGRTPLHRAARNRHLNCCRILYAAGADLNAQTAYDGTALDEALAQPKSCDNNRHISLQVMVAWLLEHGAEAARFSRLEIEERVRK
jgi:ankyrin repeat protein